VLRRCNRIGLRDERDVDAARIDGNVHGGLVSRIALVREVPIESQPLRAFPRRIDLAPHVRLLGELRRIEDECRLRRYAGLRGTCRRRGHDREQSSDRAGRIPHERVDL